MWVFGRVFGLATLAAIATFAPVRADTPAPISLAKPIACTLGQDCFIQQYADHDPGPGATDYRCGAEVYDGHDGTDFRIPDKAAQTRGVAVLAAAPGVVRGVRDGQPDFAAGAFDRTKVKGVECGNGVAVVHAGGWETQYCHLRQGSVRAKAGDTVTTGQVLGMVGQSGDAAFPHLHLTVRQSGKAVDPFAYGTTACASSGQSLWRAADRAELAYRDAQVLNSGFTTGAVTMDDIERGDVATADAHSPGLVFYVRAIALRLGDIQSLTLSGPNGQLAQSTAKPLDHDKAQVMLFAGKKRTAAQWPAGTYTATYEVTRAGKSVLKKVVTVGL